MKAKHICSLAAALGMLLPLAAMAQAVGSGAVSITTSGASENFDSLANSGTSDVLPQGWYFYESGGSHRTTYAADDGTVNSGNTYSYGAAGSSERALGSIASNTNKPQIGAKLQNNTGQTLTELLISFTTEQWRRGEGRAQDRLQFHYSTTTSGLEDATGWLEFSALDALSPATSGTTEAALDGNASANQSHVSATLTGFNLAPGETLWIRWSDINIAGADDALAIDDVVFGTPVDVPPTLVSSFPANGDTDFPSNASIILNFSEAVAVSGNWFSLVCQTSGNFGPTDATINGGPVDWYITPTGGLQAGESCDLVLFTSLIVDQDGTPDALVDPGTISFLVIAPPPNEPPTLVSTVPLNGASNFPSAGDLTAVFSEPVTADAGAFTLSCTTSTGIVLSPSSNDGITWTIGTGTALVAGDSCQFGIVAGFIHDLENAELVTGAVISFNVLDAGNLGAYYENVNLSSPAQLRCSLHETIKGHTIYPYSGSGTNTWTILELAQQDPADSNRIIDVYRNRSYARGSDRAGTGSGITYNREHSWPNSLGFASSSLAAYTDTHMLWLSDTSQNSDRGNKPYANCPSGCTELPTEVNNGVGGTGQSNWVKTPDGNGGSFEVWNHRKGEMARAMFYMAIRYEGISAEDAHDGNIPDLELTDNRSLIVATSNTAAKAYMGLLSDLLAWHQYDPPQAEELDRNTLIQSFQNNRNPFVDHPEWASMDLFTSNQPTSCVLNEHPPIVIDDTYVTAVDTVLNVAAASGVLANDNDPEGAPLSASLVTNASHGSLMLGGNGGFTYTPASGYCGTDSFTYRASDGVRDSDIATATITVGSNCGEPGPDIFKDGFE